MKQNTLLRQQWSEEDCHKASCRKCQNCKVVNLEEWKQEQKNNAPQLYAKEAENYFFYFALNMKQS